jgi:hypothetical protein
MRILMVSPFLPDAAAQHGGGVYLSSLALALAAKAELGLVAFLRRGEQERLDSDAGPWRWRGTLPYRERPPQGRLRHQLRLLWHWRHLPLVAAKHWHPAMPSLLLRALAEFRPEVVLVEMAQMAQYLPYLCSVPTVLTDHESGAPSCTRTGLGALGDRRDARLWRRYVQRFYPLATVLQTVTAEDAMSLSAALGREVHVRPPSFLVPDAPVSPGQAPPRSLFLGDYSHPPNTEAAGVLVRDVLPRLRASDPTAELWLAGPHQDRLQALADCPGVRLLGFVPDLHALFGRVRLLLAPLWSGGGFRMKVLAALAHGLPVVTNALGARGCTAPTPARTIVEGPQELADAALELLRSPTQAAAAGRAAFAWARDNLTGEAVARAQLECAAHLVAARSA